MPKSKGDVDKIEDSKKKTDDGEKNDDVCVDESCDDSKHTGLLPFDIGDHISNILDMTGILGGGKSDSGILNLIRRMTSPAMLDSIPFSSQSLDEDDQKNLDGLHGKVIMIIGHGGDHGIGDVGPIENILEKVDGRLSAIRSVGIRVAKTCNPSDAAESAQELSTAYRTLMECAGQCSVAEPNIVKVASAIKMCNPIKHRNVIDERSFEILSGVISDLSRFIPKDGFFLNAALRVKAAYHTIRDRHDDGMVKSAAVVLRNSPEDFTGRQGFNICPKFKSHANAKVSVPVEHSFCRDYCVEGRPETDGTVTCKYAQWLKTIDSHEKVMARYQMLRSPDNDNMALRLPDGKRSHPRKPEAASLEARMQTSKMNLNKNDATHNVEALLRDIVADDGEQSADNLERRLRKDSSIDAPESGTEIRLDGRNRNDPDHVENAESKIRRSFPDGGLDTDKLLDALIEEEYPRKDSKRPKER